ncbi:unnamed protein product, partial [Iphiclides podalirius]
MCDENAASERTYTCFRLANRNMYGECKNKVSDANYSARWMRAEGGGLRGGDTGACFILLRPLWPPGTVCPVYRREAMPSSSAFLVEFAETLPWNMLRRC